MLGPDLLMVLGLFDSRCVALRRRVHFDARDALGKAVKHTRYRGFDAGGKFCRARDVIVGVDLNKHGSCPKFK
jgi:hypothetical protein